MAITVRAVSGHHGNQKIAKHAGKCGKQYGKGRRHECLARLRKGNSARASIGPLQPGRRTALQMRQAMRRAPKQESYGRRYRRHKEKNCCHSPLRFAGFENSTNKKRAATNRNGIAKRSRTIHWNRRNGVDWLLVMSEVVSGIIVFGSW
jgi:hypothetical protein